MLPVRSVLVFLGLIHSTVSGQIGATPPTSTLLVCDVLRGLKSLEGDGVSKTAVTLWTIGTNQKVAETKTDEHGDFSFPEFPPQAYELQFYSPRYGPQTRRISEGDRGALYIDLMLPALNTPSTPVKTNLCELLSKPDLLHGKFVEIHAGLRSLGA